MNKNTALSESAALLFASVFRKVTHLLPGDKIALFFVKIVKYFVINMFSIEEVVDFCKSALIIFVQKTNIDDVLYEQVIPIIVDHSLDVLNNYKNMKIKQKSKTYQI